LALRFQKLSSSYTLTHY